MSQKDAVYSAVTEVFRTNGVDFEEGTSSAENLLNKSLRTKVVEILLHKMIKREIKIRTPILDRWQLIQYVENMITLWVRKDPRLVGSPVHRSVKNIRLDPQIKALKQILETTDDNEKRAEIKHFIEKRTRELLEDK